MHGLNTSGEKKSWEAGEAGYSGNPNERPKVNTVCSSGAARHVAQSQEKHTHWLRQNHRNRRWSKRLIPPARIRISRQKTQTTESSKKSKPVGRQASPYDPKALPICTNIPKKIIIGPQAVKKCQKPRQSIDHGHHPASGETN